VAQDATINPNELARINNALKSLEAMSGKTLTRLMKGASVQAARSAAKNTRAYTPGKKRKKKNINIAQTAKGRKLRERRGFPWWARYQIIAWQSGKPKNSQNEVLLYARTDSSMMRMREIPSKGVAKRAWLFSLRRLGKSMGAAKAIDAKAKRYNQTRFHEAGGVLLGVTMTNTVNYANFAARGAVGEATYRTRRWLEKRVQLEEEKLVRAFERKAARAG